MTLGERIKLSRQEVGLSQEKVAEFVGVSRQAVAKWESDQSAPSTKNLLLLAELFETTVDALASSAPPPCASQEGHTLPKGWSRKKNGLFAAEILGLFGGLFLLIQLLTCDFSQTTLLSALCGRSSGSYVLGWLVHNRLFFAVLGIMVLCALLGKRRFALTASLLFFAGILLGESFGPAPAGASFGYHDGWAIWGGVFLVSLVMGAIAERRKIPLRSKQAALWLAVTIGCCAAVVVLVVLSRPDFSAMG